MKRLVPRRDARRIAAAGLVALALAVAACVGRERPESTADTTAIGVLDTTMRVAVVMGFDGPEAVRYDPEQDVYFVSNFAGNGDAKDNNGFISRMGPDGSIERLRFIAGGAAGVTLHAPRGLLIVGDTLWAVDVDAVRGFDRRSGAPTATIDLSAFAPGFFNDIAAAPDGTLYVTDTPGNRVLRIRGRALDVALSDSALGGPNGITWDSTRRAFLIVPYFRGQTLFRWQPDGRVIERVGTIPGGSFDGVEVLAPDSVIIASQADSSLHLFVDGSARPFIRTGGEPADIGVDTRRARVAAPFISRNAVEIWRTR